jgi:hypothetical protein
MVEHGSTVKYAKEACGMRQQSTKDAASKAPPKTASGME